MVDRPRQKAFSLLLNLESHGGRIDSSLKSVFENAAFDEKDKAFVSELVYGVVRWKRSLDVITEALASRPIGKISAPVLTLLRMGLYQTLSMSKSPSYAAVNETVNLSRSHPKSRHAAGFINAVLREASRRFESKGEAPLCDLVAPLLSPDLPEVERLGRMYSFPDWIVHRWLDRFGADRAEKILMESGQRAPVFFRLNTLKIDSDDFARRMGEWGISAERLPFARDGWRLTEGRITPSSAVFSEGYVQPQDASSIVAASLLDPRRGDTIADICCGNGVKSGAFAQWMDDDGFIFSLDTSPSRLAAMSANMKRLGVSICRPVAADAARWPVKDEFKKIFMDAPCSGSGGFRRHPEGKWNKTPELIEKMALTQAEILSAAAESLAPGGLLVYSVCSIEPEEGCGLVERFLKSHGGFVKKPVGEAFPPLSGFADERGDLLILPGDGGMDGFYAAMLLKVK